VFGHEMLKFQVTISARNKVIINKCNLRSQTTFLVTIYRPYSRIVRHDCLRIVAHLIAMIKVLV
jgi:hypothetical protein